MRLPEQPNKQIIKTAALLFFIGLLVADGIIAFFLIRDQLVIFNPYKQFVYLPLVSNQISKAESQGAAPTTPIPAVTTPAPTLPVKTYTVKAGDTLWHIAQEFNVGVDELASANNLANPNYLKIGQVLVIP